MEWKKTRIVPKTRIIGQVNERTRECMLNMSSMLVGDIFHLPISTNYPEVEQDIMATRYYGSLASAASKLAPRQFRVMRRGTDVFVERIV